MEANMWLYCIAEALKASPAFAFAMILVLLIYVIVGRNAGGD